MKKFTVEAARTTGEWLSKPVMAGEVDFEQWCKMTDTDDVHYDHFDNFDEDNHGSADGVICAIEVSWVD